MDAKVLLNIVNKKIIILLLNGRNTHPIIKEVKTKLHMDLFMVI